MCLLRKYSVTYKMVNICCNWAKSKNVWKASLLVISNISTMFGSSSFNSGKGKCYAFLSQPHFKALIKLITVFWYINNTLAANYSRLLSCLNMWKTRRYPIFTIKAFSCFRSSFHKMKNIFALHILSSLNIYSRWIRIYDMGCVWFYLYFIFIFSISIFRMAYSTCLLRFLLFILQSNSISFFIRSSNISSFSLKLSLLFSVFISY